MSKRGFILSAEWGKLYHAMIDQIEEHREAALTASDFSGREYERGWVDALRSMAALPETLLTDEDSDEEHRQMSESPEETEEKAAGIVHLAPRTPRRTGFFRG